MFFVLIPRLPCTLFFDPFRPHRIATVRFAGFDVRFGFMEFGDLLPANMVPGNERLPPAPNGLRRAVSAPRLHCLSLPKWVLACPSLDIFTAPHG